MSRKPIKVIFGTAGALFTDDTAEPIYKLLQQYGCGNLDTAQLYKGKEEVIGRTGGASKFVIDTKELCGFVPKTATKDNVIQRGEESLKQMETKQVDIFYLHAPDREVPFAETLEGMNELLKAGKFKRFGLSNFKTEEVEEVIKICKEHDWVQPTAYQCNYSPVSRKQEEDLFPLLRKHSIAIYAYSPLAGGFLTKTKEDIESNSKGRFIAGKGAGDQYRALYAKPAFLEALGTWQKISEEYGIGRAELAYRWVAYDSALKRENGDAIIIGASRMEQLEESLKWFQKGPLPGYAVEKIHEVWETIKHEAGLDNFNLNN